MTTMTIDRPNVLAREAPVREESAFDLSIIVLTHNRLASLERTLDAIWRNTHGSVFELIIVNNGSTDGTREWLDSINIGAVRPIHRPENEFVCARNYGIRAARAPIIAQVDDDVVVHPGWNTVLTAPIMKDSKIGATGQHGFYQDPSWRVLIDDRRRPAPGQCCDLVMGFAYAWRNRCPTPPQDGNGQWGVGAPFVYDEDFNPFWHEESDLQMQIRAAGLRIMCVAEVATHNSLHDWDATLADRGIAAESIAKRNFERLREKWADRDVRFEGPAVGL